MALSNTRSFLNNAQSAADSANFMAYVKFEGIDEDLTAPNHPWIYYGVCAHVELVYLTLYILPEYRAHMPVLAPPT